MKKYILLLVSLFFAVTSFAQIVRTESNIAGLGQFSFGMSPEEIKKPMLVHMTDKTEIKNDIKEDGSMMLTNVTYNGYVFDACLLKFNKDGLYNISFMKFFEQGDNAIAETLVNLCHIFDIQYGKQTEEPEFDENSIMGYAWTDKNNSRLILSMLLSRKGEEHKIMVAASQKEKPVQKPSSSFSPLGLTSVPITGLAEYSFGMSADEMPETLELYKSSNTKVSGIFDGESSISVTNLKSMGYVFDRCSFTFGNNRLKSISFSMRFDKKNKDPKEFEEILSMLENDYGQRSRTIGNEPRTVYMWQNEDKKTVMLSKRTEKQYTEVVITVKVDMLDMTNLEVYQN